MAKRFNPDEYSTVEDRLKMYAEDYPDYRVDSHISYFSDKDADVVIVKSTLYKNAEEQKDGLFHSTGHAEETRGAGFVNKTSHVENCETSAIGRALANIGYTGGGKRPSLEEMEKVERTKKAIANKVTKKVESKVKDVTEVAKEKEVEANKVESGDHQSKIDSFTSLEDLLEWFNGMDDASFKEQWFSAVQAKIAKLRP